MFSSLSRFAILLIALLEINTLATAQKRIKNSASDAPTVSSRLYANREAAMQMADDIAYRRDLDKDWVRQAIGQARHLPQIAQLMLPAPRGTYKNWRVYRSRFIDPVRINAGVRFWQENEAALPKETPETKPAESGDEKPAEEKPSEEQSKEEKPN